MRRSFPKRSRGLRGELRARYKPLARLTRSPYSPLAVRHKSDRKGIRPRYRAFRVTLKWRCQLPDRRHPFLPLRLLSLPKLLCHFDQIRERLRLHLLHNISTMKFDRPFSGGQFADNLFIQQS